ncbi:MAG TPA: SpoIID/LytB domain-containing protein [Terriglobia bacterium]|nr:SpoIID/LytB domain-containing protein [Terriglobia bacterium]
MLGLFHPVELIVSPTPGSVLVIDASGRQVILGDARKAYLRIDGRQVLCRSGDEALAGFVVRGRSRQGGPADFVLSIPGKITREYRGALEVSAREGRLLPVVMMDTEVAVASAVAAESPPGAPLEALKAQSIVTRSYYLAGRRHAGFDFCDATHCQFLRGPAAADSLAVLATASTRGLVLSYQGAIVAALFSASCGGRTRSLAEVGLSSRGYPYYPAVCRYCLHHAPLWKRVLSLDYAEYLLGGSPTEADRLKIDRSGGWSTIPGNNFELEVVGESVVIQGKGQGHGIGLCQMGAFGMATGGSTFQEILDHYFPNTSLSGRDN